MRVGARDHERARERAVQLSAPTTWLPNRFWRGTVVVDDHRSLAWLTPASIRDHLNSGPLMSFGRTGVNESWKFHSCPTLSGRMGMYCTAIAMETGSER
jgi:hypothetical protein